jgi:hypothetical protein
MRWVAVVTTATTVAVGAAVLGVARTASVYQAVEYCLGGVPLDYDAGGRFAILAETVEKAGLYAIALTALSTPFLILALRRHTLRWLLTCFAFATIAGTVLFVLDDATADKVPSLATYFGRQTVAESRCPSRTP